jgi:hypothetical protein
MHQHGNKENHKKTATAETGGGGSSSVQVT